MRIRKSAFEKYLSMNHILDDYWSVSKLFDKYKKEKEKKKPNEKQLASLCTRMLPLVRDAKTSLERMQRSYNAANTAMHEAMATEIAPPELEEAKYLKELEGYSTILQNIEKEISPMSVPEPVPIPVAPPPITPTEKAIAVEAPPPVT